MSSSIVISCLDYATKQKLCFIAVLPARIRIDKGTETVELAAMHSYLLDKQVKFLANPLSE